MSSTLEHAAQALAAGDPLAALDLVALRDDGPGLALRGIAMAQMGELPRARTLLRDAARKLGPGDPLAAARCTTAQVEVILAQRGLGAPVEDLEAAIEVLEAHGDRLNATHARLLRLRWSLLLGRLADAEQQRAALSLEGAPPMLRAIALLAAADIAVRRVRARDAAHAVHGALQAAQRAGIPALVAEIEGMARQLRQPAARLWSPAAAHPVRLAEVEDVLGSPALVVDGCRRSVRRRGVVCSLVRRPVLFELAAALARAWPGGATRESLRAEVFQAEASNASWRARLRVEIGRLRTLLKGLAAVEATPQGFALRPVDAADVVILLPPFDGEHAAVLALLGDGAAWSTSALALALGVSQRSAQRALAALAQAGRVRALGRARSARWVAPPASGFTPALLLPRVGGIG